MRCQWQRWQGVCNGTGGAIGKEEEEEEEEEC